MGKLWDTHRFDGPLMEKFSYVKMDRPWKYTKIRSTFFNGKPYIFNWIFVKI